MNELDLLNKLAAQSRHEAPPRVHAVAGVMAHIRALETNNPPLAAWWVAAGLSAAIAAVVLIVALQAWQTSDQPLWQWLTPMEMVLR